MFFFQDRLRQQERIREDQLLEEAQIRQEKLNLIRQEETLLLRQEEMLRQIQEEKLKLMRQEDLIRSRQQERLKQVRAEKALLEQQEQMLKLREEQLLQERRRQEKLREEASHLRRQEEEIRRRQEEIAKELMCGAAAGLNEGPGKSSGNQAYVGRKPFYKESVLDSSIVNVQQLNTSDWSSSDAESFMPVSALNAATSTYKGANENYDESPFVLQSVEESQQHQQQGTEGGTSEDEDTMEEEEDCYECKVEVKQQNTQVPTSVRTIETVIDVPGWAPITPYLNVSRHMPTTTTHEDLPHSGLSYKIVSGVVTSPESILTSANLITTPDSSISLQSQISINDDHSMESSSCPVSPLPPALPPQPSELSELKRLSTDGNFQTVQPEVPPRDDSFAVTAVYSNVVAANPTRVIAPVISQGAGSKNQQRKSLIEMDHITVPKVGASAVIHDPQSSPRLGGPGSAFRPYASSENLFDPNLAATLMAAKPPQPPVSSNGHLTGTARSEDKVAITKRHSTSSIRPHQIAESDEDFFLPRVRQPHHQQRAPIMSTTDTEPEMKEFNLAPIGSEKKGKKHQKIFYSTSETEEEYQAYLKSKPKWHGKGGHKDSWDPLLIASPPQIVQRPVGVVQKPKPHLKIERGTEVHSASAFQMYPSGQEQQAQIHFQQQQFLQQEPQQQKQHTPQQFKEQYQTTSQYQQQNKTNLNLDLPPAETAPSMSSLAPPPNYERIQKSDSIIELRKAAVIQQPSGELTQKSSSVTEIMKSGNAINMNVPFTFTKPLESEAAESTSPISAAYFKQQANSLQVPYISSPPDSEDQATPQAPRRSFLPYQTSFDSSFSEPEESNENLAPQLKSNKEDPETKKKKEIHKNLMSEALKKVELRNNQKKNFSQLSRTNPTIAALGIVTRKELKMEELENRQEQELLLLHSRKHSGNNINQEESNSKATGGVNANVLQSFRQQTLLKNNNPSQNLAANSSIREAEIQAKKAVIPASKPDLLPKPGEMARKLSQDALISTENTEPVVLLKKQPRILDQEELKARQVVSEKPSLKADNEQIDTSPTVEYQQQQQNVVSLVVSGKHSLSLSSQNSSSLNKDEQLKKTGSSKKSQADIDNEVARANEKVLAAQQKLQLKQQQEHSGNSLARQALQGIVQVRPKPTTDSPRFNQSSKEEGKKTSNKDEETSKEERPTNNAGVASVKKAAERFEQSLIAEANNSTSGTQLEASAASFAMSSQQKTRSKSIGNAITEQLKDNCSSVGNNKSNLPWAVKSPPVLRKREAASSIGRNRGYALQMSKSSDSITAAKLLAKARAEQRDTGGGFGGAGLRINKNFSKSIEQQIDIYSKTREEIQMILMLAKSGSVNDRIALFSNLMNKGPDSNSLDLESKAERIRQEIEEARAAQKHQETTVVSDTEIEFQDPIESKVKPLKIPMKPKLLGNPEPSRRMSPKSPASSLRINRNSQATSGEFPIIPAARGNYLSARDKEEDSPKSILLRKVPEANLRQERERSRSPKKKAPKLLSDHLLTPHSSFQIYAQSATDMSATEDEAEAAWAMKKRLETSSGGTLQKQGEPGPSLLQVPDHPVQKHHHRTGIMKSKSFASPYECYLDDTTVTAKKMTMMAFFGHDTKTKTSSHGGLENKPNQMQTQTRDLLHEELWADGVNDEDDDDELVDVDAEFENLLNRTFEQESLCLSENVGLMPGGGAEMRKEGSRTKESSASNAHSQAEKAGGRSGGKKVGGPVNAASSVVRDSEALQHQTSYNAASGSTSDVIGVNSSKMFINNNTQFHRQKGFDPLAALPTSQSKQYAGRRPPPHSPLGDGHSPSPTQSEYDTCDPWDEN